MKKHLLKKLSTFIVTAIMFSATANAQTTFTLLHVNDTHSHLDAFGPKDATLEGTIGGIAKAATIIGTVRATEPNVLLLHAGDIFVGDPMFNTYFGIPELQLMQQLGFDAMVVGNHELDFGAGVLYNSLATAFASGSFPLVSANLDMTGFPPLQTFVQPSIMKTIAGVKIGIFGMTVPDSPTTNAAPAVIRSDLVTIAQQTASALRTSGADVVICLSHLGIFYDKIVAENTYGIDFIIGGHDHYLFQQPRSFNNLNGTPVPVFQAGEEYKYIGKMHFTVNAGVVTINDYQIINVDQSVPFYQPIQNVIESLKPGVMALFGDVYHTVIGTTNNMLNYRYDTSTRFRDTPLGNLIADAFRNKTETDIAIDPIGLMRDDIYPGTIVGADVFRSMSLVGGYEPSPSPHLVGYKLATFNITGAELIHGMEFSLSQLEVGPDFFLQISGFRYKYDLTKPVGQRVIIRSIKMDGRKKFSPAATYSVTVNEGSAGLLGLVGVTVTNLQIRSEFEWSVVKDYIAKLGKLNNYHSQGRVVEQLQSTRIMAENFSGENNFSLFAYPNPFSNSTTISFSLAQSEKVSLKIFDLNRRLIKTLADNVFEEGEHSIEWNAEKVNAGIYFLQVQSAEFSKTEKLIVAN